MTNNRLPPATGLGHVALRVPRLGAALDFYSEMLGMREVEREAQIVVLAASEGGKPLLVLEEALQAPVRPPRTTGLFHLAVRYPDRQALARTLQRLIDHRWPLQGFSDHAVSEAIYLADPHGNGVELYTDRPRSVWPKQGDKIAMTTVALNVGALLRAAGDPPEPWMGIHPETDIGHIHLQVADLERAEAFYHGLLGFDVTQRDYPGALFLSAGGYHHHIGLNVWAGIGAPPPPPQSLGLRAFAVVLPAGEDLLGLVDRLGDAGVPREPWRSYGPWEGLAALDPDGIQVELLAESDLLTAEQRKAIRGGQ